MAQTSKVVVINHLTLDGVYQAPARDDEDLRDDFAHGGWAMERNDPKMQEVMGKYMGHSWSLLVGSTTYEDLYEGWHNRQPEHPMTKALAGVEKFVASHNPNYELPWENSTLLKGDAVDAVAKLKKDYDKPLIIFGSGVLVRSLMEQDLIDEFVLMIHPLILGKGRRFFDDAPLAKLTLVSEITTESGVIVATYKPTP